MRRQLVGDLFPDLIGQNQVCTHFTRFDWREHTIPLTANADSDKLLVAQYAWDGNAFPGNEYWLGQLSASGDPAAASCSTIPLVHNVDFNPGLLDPKRVCAYPDNAARADSDNRTM